MKNLIFIIALLLTANFAEGATYYIRTDGGTDSQCDGKYDAAQSGATDSGDAGSLPDCAYSHPYEALRVRNSYDSGLFAGGDTMIISPGTYDMGAGHRTTGDGSGSECNPTYSYDCRWDIPSGPSSGNPTRILGKGYDTETGTRPVLRGIGEIYNGVINMMSGQDNIEIQYFDITDNEACISSDEVPSGSACSGDFARHGIWSQSGSNNVLVKNVKIHGVSKACVMFPGASNWTFDNFHCRGVGHVGFDNDIANPDQSGTMTMTDSEVEYVGCVEELNGNIRSQSCIGDTGEGLLGYGDAFGFGDGSMANWDITNLSCHNNMSDCFDGLHGSSAYTIKIKNSKFWANIGAAVKGSAAGSTILENNIIIDDCAWPLYQNMLDPISLSGGSRAGEIIMCRPDATISLQMTNNVTHKLIGNTLFGNHDEIVVVACGGSNRTGDSVYMRNNIFYGGTDWMQDSTVAAPYTPTSPDPGQTDSYYFYDGCDQGTDLDEDYNIFYNSKDGSSDVIGSNSYYGNPGFIGTIKTGPANTTGYFSTLEGEIDNFYLSSSSVARYENARGAATANESVTCWGDCSNDNNLFARGSNWDTGALEYGSVPSEGGGDSTVNPGPRINGGVRLIGAIDL